MEQVGLLLPCPHCVVQLKSKLRTALAVAITTDGWQSKAIKSFLSVTVHWLDDEFGMQRAVLGVERIKGSHTHENIAAALRALLSAFELLDKAAHGTSDNAEAWVGAVKEVTGLSSRCFAHSLQLIIKWATEANAALITKARDLVSVFHHSPGKVEVLEAMQKELDMAKKKLVSDVSTRWQATYLMLESVVENEKALDLACSVIPAEKRLSEQEFAQLRELAAGMRPYYEITTRLEGEQYPTMNELLPRWFSLVEDAEDYAKTRCMCALVRPVIHGFQVCPGKTCRQAAQGDGQEVRQDHLARRCTGLPAGPSIPADAVFRA